jgi:hypothetical protein
MPKDRHRLRPSPTILDENVGAQFIEPVSAGSMNRTPTGQAVGAARSLSRKSGVAAQKKGRHAERSA